MGPTTGIQLYDQSPDPFLPIGRMECIMRGAKSRAGLIANPVGPPSPIPITVTNKATGRAPVSALMEIISFRNKYFQTSGVYIPIIVDGGLQTNADINIALTIGDIVMMGG